MISPTTMIPMPNQFASPLNQEWRTLSSLSAEPTVTTLLALYAIFSNIEKMLMERHLSAFAPKFLLIVSFVFGKECSLDLFMVKYCWGFPCEDTVEPLYMDTLGTPNTYPYNPEYL
jgi:hypothetical protein